MPTIKLLGSSPYILLNLLAPISKNLMLHGPYLYLDIQWTFTLGSNIDIKCSNLQIMNISLWSCHLGLTWMMGSHATSKLMGCGLPLSAYGLLLHGVPPVLSPEAPPPKHGLTTIRMFKWCILLGEFTRHVYVYTRVWQGYLFKGYLIIHP